MLDDKFDSKYDSSHNSRVEIIDVKIIEFMKPHAFTTRVFRSLELEALGESEASC